MTSTSCRPHVLETGQAAKPGDPHSWQCYLKYDLIAMLACDGVAMIDNHLQSKGAMLEGYLAMQVGLPIKSCREWVSLAVRESLSAPLHFRTVQVYPSTCEKHEIIDCAQVCRCRRVRSPRRWRGSSMSATIESGDLVEVIGGAHRGEVGLYLSRETYGGTTGYVEIYVDGKKGKQGRHLKINENLLEKYADDADCTPCMAVPALTGFCVPACASGPTWPGSVTPLS